MNIYRIFEFLFNQWKYELDKKETIPVYANGHLDMPIRYDTIYTYKLTNKFDGSVKYKIEKFSN